MTPCPKRFAPRPCEIMDDRLDELLDDELDEQTLAELEQQAESDPALQRALRLHGVLRGMPAYACPDTVADAVKTSARRSSAERRKGTYLRGTWAAMGLAAAIALLVIVLPLDASLNDSEYSEAEVDEALAHVRLAFAVVSDAGDIAGETVRDEVLLRRTVDPVRRTVYRSLFDINHDIQ